MSFINLLSSFTRSLNMGLSSQTRYISTNVSPLCFQTTNALFGEPLKKKKRLDPAIIKQREDRKKRKIEKRIRRLEKVSKQLKPIDETEVQLKLIDERDMRLRKMPPLPVEELERRSLLQKDWSRYKSQQRYHDLHILDNMLFSQQRALDELKAVSEDLYNEAIQVDLTLLPFESKGPVFTPPIENYDTPDGEHTDVTKKFDGEE